jgi:hypothetical protein
VQKREKSFYWHTTCSCKPNCMSSFLLHPLNSGCLWLPTTWVPPDSPTTHPNPFPQSVLFFLSTSWLKIPETILLTHVLIYILSVCLASSLPLVLAGGSDGRFWIRVVKSSFEFACIFVKHIQFCWLWTKHDGTSTLFTEKSSNQCWQVISFDPVINPGPGTK